MDEKLKISWVIPCFNEELVIEETFKRISNVNKSLNQYLWEIVFIDDGSNDNTNLIIRNLVNNNSNIVLISLSKNYGHQTAVQAGIDYVDSNAVIIIDSDLQDPPEIAIDMVNKWMEGYEVVYGLRINRDSETFFKKTSAKLFYRFLNFLSNTKIPVDTGDFRLIDKKIVLSLRKMPEKGRYLRGLISWAGFKQTEVSYFRDKRYAGKANTL